MTKYLNTKQVRIVLTIALLIVIAVYFSSCNSLYRLTHKRHPLPISFTDTLNLIKADLEKRDRYLFYMSITGNCFGPSYSGHAKIQWFENDKYYCRTIFKKTQDKKVTDQTVECNIDSIFQTFRANRLDTVTTLPKGYIYIDPATMAYIKIKDNELIYEKSFEEIPISTSQDSTHILFSFFETILKQ